MLHELHIDLLTGLRHMQSAGLAPIDQELGPKRGQTIARLRKCKKGTTKPGTCRLRLHGTNLRTPSRFAYDQLLSQTWALLRYSNQPRTHDTITLSVYLILQISTRYPGSLVC